MKNNNNSSFLSHRGNPNNDHHPHQCQKPRVFICEFCHKVFSTGQALGGHKTSHRTNNKQIHDDHYDVNKGYKTMKITFTLSSSPSNTEQKRHSWTRVFKASVHHPPTASTMKPIEQQELPVVDLLSLLPPRLYTTKKRSRRYLVQDGLANKTAPKSLLDMSRESVANLDLNHRECKRMKLSSNGNDIEMMQKQQVLPLVKETESVHELEPRVVGDFDMAFKGIVHHPPTALEPSQQEIPAVDLLSLLPPRSYTTKKRSRRYDDGVANNNTAPIPMLDMSRESIANLGLNHRECKRMKLSSNVNDTEMMQELFMPLTSDGIDETIVKEEKNPSQGETLVSRVVRNFDLNELPMNDVETKFGSRVVRNFDLNELPTNDVADEIIYHK